MWSRTNKSLYFTLELRKKDLDNPELIKLLDGFFYPVGKGGQMALGYLCNSETLQPVPSLCSLNWNTLSG